MFLLVAETSIIGVAMVVGNGCSGNVVIILNRKNHNVVMQFFLLSSNGNNIKGAVVKFVFTIINFVVIIISVLLFSC